MCRFLVENVLRSMSPDAKIMHMFCIHCLRGDLVYCQRPRHSVTGRTAAHPVDTLRRRFFEFLGNASFMYRYVTVRRCSRCRFIRKRMQYLSARTHAF